MKVLLVNDCPPELHGSGGVETHVRQLQHALTDRGITTALLASQTPDLPAETNQELVLIPNFVSPPLRKHVLKNIQQQRNALDTAEQFIQNFQPDIIHVHNMMNPAVLHMLRRHGPVIKSIHDCRPFCSRPRPDVASRLIGDSENFCAGKFGLHCWLHCYAGAGHSPMERIESWSYFLANLRALTETLQVDRLIVYSRYLEKLALTRFRIARNVHVVYHLSDAEQAAKNFIPSAVREPLFLFAGRLSPEKGIFHIFDALERIPDVACRLIIAGDGPARAEIEQRIAACSPRHHIELLGYIGQEKLYDLYRLPGTLLFPSIGSEGCPLTGIEAMYFGMPAIGFDVGGVGEWLIDGKTGILLRRRDIDGLARAMRCLIADPDRTARMGRQAQAFVQKKFRRETHVNQLIEIYEQTRGERKKPLYENR